MIFFVWLFVFSFFVILEGVCIFGFLVGFGFVEGLLWVVGLGDGWWIFCFDVWDVFDFREYFFWGVDGLGRKWRSLDFVREFLFGGVWGLGGWWVSFDFVWGRVGWCYVVLDCR